MAYNLRDVLKSISTQTAPAAKVIPHPSSEKILDTLANKIREAQNHAVVWQGERTQLDELYSQECARIDEKIQQFERQAAELRAEYNDEIERRGVRGVLPVGVKRDKDATGGTPDA